MQVVLHPWIKYISILLWIVWTIGEGFKIFKFIDKRDVKTGAFVHTTSDRQAPTDLTICIAFNIKLVKYSRILVTPGTDDIEILVPATLDRFYTKFINVLLQSQRSK